MSLPIMIEFVPEVLKLFPRQMLLVPLTVMVFPTIRLFTVELEEEEEEEDVVMFISTFLNWCFVKVLYSWNEVCRGTSPSGMLTISLSDVVKLQPPGVKL